MASMDIEKTTTSDTKTNASVKAPVVIPESVLKKT